METQPNIKVTVAANITYGGLTYNTKLLLEYQHTGKQYYYTKRGQKRLKYTENIDIAMDMKKEGYKVTERPGYYFVKRLAIPTINAVGKSDIWYINNDGDCYRVNKISKYAQKLHAEISKEDKSQYKQI